MNECMAMIMPTEAVSYTHLDVYKRQGLTSLNVGRVAPSLVLAVLQEYGRCSPHNHRFSVSVH